MDGLANLGGKSHTREVRGGRIRNQQTERTGKVMQLGIIFYDKESLKKAFTLLLKQGNEV